MTWSDGPAHRYYASLVGAWSGRFDLQVTDREAMRSAPFPARASARLASPLGGYSMSTTLAGTGRDWHHTTRVEKFGLTLFTSDETIAIADDGRSFRITGVQHPLVGPEERYEGPGEIDPSASGATYRITWAGAPLQQRTAILPEGLQLTQETAWVVLLRRR